VFAVLGLVRDIVLMTQVEDVFNKLGRIIFGIAMHCLVGELRKKTEKY